MELKLDNIYQGDCLELMKFIPDNSIDAVICDLPYEVLNDGNPNAQWDKQIPFEPMWAQYERIIKPTAPIVLFAQGMFTSDLMQSNRKMWRYNLIWDKGRTSGHLNANRMPLRQHEDIVVFYKQLPTYNPQMMKDGQKHHRGGQGTNVNNVYGNFDSMKTSYHNERFPTSIIQFDKKVAAGQTNHPTEKPVDLLRYLVLTYTNEGDVVLDNCSGSGSTAVACWKEKRHFICIEKDPVYYEKSVKRIKTEMAQLRLF